MTVGGSIPISRYIAERNGLGGSNAMENAQLESYIDILFDLGSHFYGIFTGPEDKKEVCRQEYLKNTPAKLAFLEKQIKSEKNFLPGDKLSYADIHVSIYHDVLYKVGLGAIFKDCPKIESVAKSFSELERIMEYRSRTYKLPI